MDHLLQVLQPLLHLMITMEHLLQFQVPPGVHLLQPTITMEPLLQVLQLPMDHQPLLQVPQGVLLLQPVITMDHLLQVLQLQLPMETILS